MNPGVALFLVAALAPAVPTPAANFPGTLTLAQDFDSFPPEEAPPPPPPEPAPAPRQAAPRQPVEPAPPPAPPPDIWVQRSTVELVGLDKVSGRATVLSGRVGQELHFGTLTVLARACVVRPPDTAPDAAAFLEITDSRPGPTPFHAWMLVSEPAVSIYEHPVFDIRLTGCRAGP